MNAPTHTSTHKATGRSRLRDLVGELPAVIRGSFVDAQGKSQENAFSRFKSDPYYFLRYYAGNIVAISAMTVLSELFFQNTSGMNYLPFWLLGLVLFVLPSFALIFLSGLYYVVLCLLVQRDVFTFAAAALIPAGILAGTVSAAIMHNAAHSNFRSRALNRFCGEVCGLFQLSGFAGWSVSHFIHHAAPDNPGKDAHAPGETTFGQYVNAMGDMMKRSMTDNYFKAFGVNRHSEATWGLVTILLPAVRYLRVLFILCLFGPALFVLFYIPFKISNTMIYGDFNFRTHRPHRDGGYEVLNLDHNIWYKILNLISIGSYYHKNHHRNPNVFNPRDVVDDGRPFITYNR